MKRAPKVDNLPTSTVAHCSGCAAVNADYARLFNECQELRARLEDDACMDALDKLWQLVYPGKTDWDYPGMVYRHVHEWMKEIAAGAEFKVTESEKGDSA